MSHITQYSPPPPPPNMIRVKKQNGKNIPSECKAQYICLDFFYLLWILFISNINQLTSIESIIISFISNKKFILNKRISFWQKNWSVEDFRDFFWSRSRDESRDPDPALTMLIILDSNSERGAQIFTKDILFFIRVRRVLS